MNSYRVEFEYEVQYVDATDSDTAVWKAQEQAKERGVEEVGELISLILYSGNTSTELVCDAATRKALSKNNQKFKVTLPSRRQKGLTLSIDENPDLESGYDLTVGCFGYYASLACAANEGELYGGRYGDSYRQLSDAQQKVVDEWEDYADLYIEEMKGK